MNRAIAAVAAASFALAGAAGAGEMPRTQLKVLGLQSHLNSYRTGEAPFWNERVPVASSGAVEAVLTPQDMMGLKGAEVLRLMRLGVLDFASGVLGYMSADHPEFEAIDLPGLAADIDAVRKVAEAWKPELGRIMEEQYGVKLLMLFPSPPQVFWCNVEMAGAADLKGRTVRVFNKSMSDMVAGLGAAPVNMAYGEVAPALERGAIDCAITGTLSGNTSKMFEVTTHLWPLYAGWSMHFHGASLAAWKGLDPLVRTFLLEEMDAFEDRLWRTVAEEIEDGLRCSTGAEPCVHGYRGAMDLVEVSESDRELQARILRESILPDWAARCGAECVEAWNAAVGPVVGVEIDPPL